MSLPLEVDTSSNAQHDQRNASHTDQQEGQRDEIVFEPMPIIGKHDAHPVFERPLVLGSENRWALHV